MRFSKALLWFLLGCAIAAGWYWYHGWQHWLSHGTGSYNTPGTPHNYNFNSGFGSIIEPPLITLAGVVLLFWWHHQCHVAGCWWYARRTTEAGDRACFIHHPDRKLTKFELHARHHAAVDRANGKEESQQ